MKMIRPSAGGYIKKDNLIYLAKPHSEKDTCSSCAFHNFSDCSNIDCTHGNVIFEDVTDRIEVELVEEFNGFGRFTLVVGAVVVIVVIVVIVIQWGMPHCQSIINN
jgi:hypothetical protein